MDDQELDRLADRVTTRMKRPRAVVDAMANNLPTLIAVIAFGVTAYAKLETLGVQITNLDRAIIEQRSVISAHSVLPAHHAAAIKLNELQIIDKERASAIEDRLRRIEARLRIRSEDDS